MSDLISRQAAIACAKGALFPCDNTDDFAKATNLLQVLEELPPIEPKKGKWVERGENNDGTHNIQCSACEAVYKSKGHANSIYTKDRFHFCPNCGAKMERSEE